MIENERSACRNLAPSGASQGKRFRKRKAAYNRFGSGKDLQSLVPAASPLLFDDGLLLLDLQINFCIIEPHQGRLIKPLGLVQNKLFVPCCDNPDIRTKQNNDPEGFFHRFTLIRNNNRNSFYFQISFL